MPLNVISKARLRAFWELHPKAQGPLQSWHSTVQKATWTCFADVKRTYNRTDAVNELLVFDVNSYRIVASPDYKGRRVYIRHVFTHNEYDAWTASMRGKKR